MGEKQNDTWVDWLMSEVHPSQRSVDLGQPLWTDSQSSGAGSEETLAEGPAPAEPFDLLAPVPFVRFEGLPDRYEDLGPLGEGGMGEVRRVRDRELNRSMALKVIKASVRTNHETLARFVEEAQVTAQLQHPGVVPVHELGRLADGRLYFTMQEVRGRTLRAVIQEVHQQARLGTSRPTAGGWTFRRLIDVFRRVCETVAYAHARGVVHRDLKPQNIMVGEYGAVLVLDWGLAKVLGRPGLDLDELIHTARSGDDSMATRQGRVSGTPAYMPPEQARGLRDLLGPPSDVWSLGAVLFEILSGRPPFCGLDARDVLLRVVKHAIEPMLGALPIPAELEAVVRRAMDPEPSRRHTDADALAAEVADWLEGARRQEQALAIVAEADALLPRVARLQERAAELRAEARALLDPLPPHATVDQKRPGWRKEDEAQSLEDQARLVELTWLRKLYSALNLAPELPEAHDRLADHYLAMHREAEAARDGTGAALQELQLRAHDRGRHAAYLEGQGALSLLTDPPGAEVWLHRYELVDRRLVPVFDRVLGTAPIRDLSLPKGSYLLTLRAPGCVEVRYPVLIERGAHWDGVPPGEAAPLPVRLPREDELGPDEVYVPGGWFISGGDPEAADGLPRRRLWVDGFAMQRLPVTCAQYLTFLNGLLEEGREEDALRFAPSKDVQEGTRHGLHALWTRDERGRYGLPGGAEAEGPGHELPVTLVSHAAAEAMAGWRCQREGRPWRLPHDQEWEKAARGVDGRIFPWGDFLDPTRACFVASHAGPPGPVSVEDFPLDEGPCGARHMAGLIRNWCANGYRREGLPPGALRLDLQAMAEPGSDYRMVRGGSWGSTGQFVRPAGRFANRPLFRSQLIGFRLVRSL